MALIVWIVGAIMVGMFAASKGRSGILFLLLSLIVSPFLGLLAALIASSR